jgi:hypothetical protein
MRFRLSRFRAGIVVATLAAVSGAVWYFFLRPDPGDPRLNAFVAAHPPVEIVFTSRSEPLSFMAAAPEGEGFTYPGMRLWAAREGRLRLLTPRGTVHELTWGKMLPDGSTLIDVMSPSVSLDGKRIYFAGRKGGGDAGRFRLYEVGVDGSGLRQLTGGPDDPGCTAVPPLRFRADGSIMPDAERRAIDYDDVDPVELNFRKRRIVFASSRTPDLGRDHARRSTTLWTLHADGTREPASANRNNDRWPFLFPSKVIGFSLWSRNREVVTADGSDIQPYREGMDCSTLPTDNWLGAFQQTVGSHFGNLVKTPVPVWRPRPLFNGRIAFMTMFPQPALMEQITAVQAAPGLLANSPSSIQARQPLPLQSEYRLHRAPERDAAGRMLFSATPSPCPPNEIVFSAAAVHEGQSTPEPGRYGIYISGDNWPVDQPPSPGQINMRLLFDDPELVDAEPVAVYARKIDAHDDVQSGAEGQIAQSGEIALANGSSYRGLYGSIFATALFDSQMGDLSGQKTDIQQGPIFAAPPRDSIDHLRIYAAHRDRFDDPVQPRIVGSWEFLLQVPVKDGQAGGRIPIGSPTVLAGFDKQGRVVKWTTAARDSLGRQATFYAYAGDHYSLVKPLGRPFCTGCHAGHSGFSGTFQDQHRERSK